MSPAIPNRHGESQAFGYLCVDSFMKTVVDARALATAFELRLIDYLRENPASNLDGLQKRFEGNSRGLQLLINLLRANRVIAVDNGKVKLSPEFQKALQYRDLLEGKLEFAQFVLPDFTDLFTSLITSPGQFGPNSRIFQLFCYGRSLEYTPENYELTKRWVRITTKSSIGKWVFKTLPLKNYIWRRPFLSQPQRKGFDRQSF